MYTVILIYAAAMLAITLLAELDKLPEAERMNA